MNKVAIYCAVLFACTSVFAGPKGVINVPRAPGVMTIDGDLSDWNLSRYTQISQQPEFPDAKEALSTDAIGDHIVWDPDRVSGFNGSIIDDFDPDDPSEFGVSMYFTYDDSYLYVLGVFIDEELNGERGENGFQNFFNDGFEMFFDSLGDSDDPADEFAFPNFDTEDNAAENPDVTANPDDFQATFGLNDFFPRPNAGPNDLGSRQHYERGGDPDLIEPGYREELDSLDLSAVGGIDSAATAYSDLRAAGALNPEIVENPGTVYEGYIAEVLIPWGITDGFEPTHAMGFETFFRDTDIVGDPDPWAGGSDIFWTDWTQNEDVGSVAGAEQPTGLFHTANWAELRFLTNDPCDVNGDGTCDANDIDAMTQKVMDGEATQADRKALIDSPFPAGLNSWVGDSDENGQFDEQDFVKVFIEGKYLTGEKAVYVEGDWDGNFLADEQDFVAAFIAGGYLKGQRPPAAVSAVPEPSSLVLLALGMLAFAHRRH